MSSPSPNTISTERPRSTAEQKPGKSIFHALPFFLLIVFVLGSGAPELQARQRIFVVRSDVWQLIKEMSLAKAQERSAFQLAAALQAVLDIPMEEESSKRGVREEMSRAIQCVSVRFPPGLERQKLTTTLEGATFNTKKRARIYGTYNDALSNTAFRLPEGDTCWPEEKMLIERREEGPSPPYVE